LASLKPRLKEVSTLTIYDRWGTYPSHGLTPQRLTAILKEADAGDITRAMELYEEIESKDAHVSGVLRARKLAVTAYDWQIIPSSDKKRDKKIADFVKDVFDWIPNFDGFLHSLLDAIAKGFSAAEVMWVIEDGQVWIKEIKEIPQTKLTFYDPGDFSKVLETPMLYIGTNEAIPFPDRKIVFHVHEPRWRAPYRGGVMRSIAWFYLFKSYAIKDWLAFNEIYGIPPRIGKYKAGMEKTEALQALKDAVVQIGSDAAAVISDDTMIEFVDTVKSGSITTFEKLIQYCDSAISKAVLTQTLTTEEGRRTGSLAQAKVHGDKEYLVNVFDCRRIMETINKQLIRWIVDYNFGEDVDIPKFKINYEKKEDLNERAKRDKNLFDIGAKFDQQYFETVYGLPHIEENQGFHEFQDDDIVSPDDISGLEAYQKEIEVLTAKLTKKDIQQMLEEIGTKVTAFEGEAKERLMKTLQPLIEGLAQGEIEVGEAIDKLTGLFSDPAMQEAASVAMDPQKRAVLYLRNELKNIYAEANERVARIAHPHEKLYVYSSGPRDKRTADDSKSVEALTNPKFGGTPLPIKEYYNHPIVQQSKRPNDRGTDIIVPFSQLPKDVQERIKKREKRSKKK